LKPLRQPRASIRLSWDPSFIKDAPTKSREKIDVTRQFLCCNPQVKEDSTHCMLQSYRSFRRVNVVAFASEVVMKTFLNLLVIFSSQQRFVISSVSMSFVKRQVCPISAGTWLWILWKWSEIS
jgi:hypothetical protein